MQTLRRAAAALAIMTLAATTATACSDDDDKKGSGGTGAVEEASDVDEIKELVDGYTTRPTEIGFDELFEGEIEPGKEIAWVRCSPPSCVALGQPLKEAVEAVGWEFREIDAGVTPESVKAAWQLLLQDPPDAVVTLSAPTSQYADEIKQIRDMGIPVVVQSMPDEPTDEGVTFNYTGLEYFYDTGQRLAQYFLANRDPEADTDVLLARTSAIPTIDNAQVGFEEYLDETCDNCNVESIEIPLETLGGDAPQTIVSYLSAHPEVKWVYTGFVDVNIGLVQALEASGLDDVQVLTVNTTVTQNQEILDGAPIVAAAYPEQEVSYRIVDWFLRFFDDQPTAPAEEAPLPTFLITPDNIPGEEFFIVDGGDQQFLELWGLN